MASQEIITSEKPKLTAEQMVVHDTSEYSMLFDSAKFNQAWRVATAFSSSGLVPDHFKDNPAGVFVVLHMATRLQLDPFMVLQKTYMVHGRPGMEAQLIIALVNARGPFTGPIQWRFEGEGKTRKCTAYATNAKTGEVCEMPVTWEMVEAEGWNKDKQLRGGSGVQKSKWNTIPEMMFRYRSATFLARAYCPEVIMGLSTADELEDSILTLDSGVTISPKPRMAIPELPVVDEEVIKKFDDFVGEKVEVKDTKDFDKFLAACVKSYKISLEELKAKASTETDFNALWDTFKKWQQKHVKKSTTPPAPEVATEGQGVGEEPPRGITEDQRNYLGAIPDHLQEKAWDALDCEVPISELDFETAEKLIAWLKANS